MFLIDLTNSVDNNKLYGGNAGFKRGITIDGPNWIIKLRLFGLKKVMIKVV